MEIFNQAKNRSDSGHSNGRDAEDAQTPSRSFHFQLSVWISFIFLACIKLSLVNGQKLFAVTDGWHDDRLFINMAVNILQGNWIGEFNNLTFSKGSFYPLWIAGNFIIGMPLLASQQLLYVFACLLFVFAARPIIKNNFYIVFAFAFLLFNPASFASQTMTQVMRDGIYASQTLIVIGSAFGILLRRNASFKHSLIWSVLLGISLSSFWLTREEGIWITPLLFITFGFYLVLIIKNYNNHSLLTLLKKSLILILPFLMLALSVLSISIINYSKYGIFKTVEFKSKNFLSAYGALTRVKHENWKPDVAVPKDVRMKLYQASPSFAELKPHLEGSIGELWLQISNYAAAHCYYPTSRSNYNEIRTGFFVWAIKDAVQAAGYYANAAMADKYYERLGKEINSACDAGTLECLTGKRATMTPVWHNEYIQPVVKSFLNGAVLVVKCDGIWEAPISSGNTDDPKALLLFSDITREELSFKDNYKNYFPLQARYDQIKLSILKNIHQLYAFVIPILTLLTIPVLFILAMFLKKEPACKDFLVISIGLISIFMTRLLLLSFLNESSFPAINIRYLSPLHAVLIVFIVIILYNFKKAVSAAFKFIR